MNWIFGIIIGLLLALFLVSAVSALNLPQPWNRIGVTGAIIMAVWLSWKSIMKRRVLFGTSREADE